MAVRTRRKGLRRRGRRILRGVINFFAGAAFGGIIDVIVATSLEPGFFGEGLEAVVVYVPAPVVCGFIAVVLAERFRRIER